MKRLLILFLLMCSGQFLFAQNIKKLQIDDLVRIIDSSKTPLIVNFWASWCAPCIHEIPWFESAVAEYKDKHVKLLLVSLDFKEDYPKNLPAFIKKNNYQSEVVWLNETNADTFCPKIDSSWDGAIPVSLFINKATNYRSFFNRQVTAPQVKIEIEKMTKP